MKSSLWRVSILVLLTWLMLTPAAFGRWTYLSEIPIDGARSYRGITLSNDEETLYVVGL